jgi:alpha-galactosidase
MMVSSACVRAAGHDGGRPVTADRSLKLRIWTLLLISCTGSGCGSKQSPPKGWSSWYAFYENVSDAGVRHQADLLVSTGLRDAGYIYVVVAAGKIIEMRRGISIPIATSLTWRH